MCLVVLAIVALAVSATSAAAVHHRPTKPTFIIQDATLYSFNLTKSKTFLNTTLRVTISAGNPNPRAGIEYDTLGIYAAYRDQQVTNFADLVHGYLGPKKVVTWAPALMTGDGEDVPVTRAQARAVGRDLQAGLVVMNVTVNGRMRWKVGPRRSKKYYLAAYCPAYLRASEGKSGGVGGGVKYQLDQGCSVTLST
ncbi:unnamed protein product [Linum trigynum]|uniref:Late embryogenesis abundant protein LEA-2 subgroup domain-containing protein n=1 Tax=Linum trigynum TaxID=586398 RepID=A0AAV2FZU8_9ROSI